MMTAATGFSNDGCPCFHAAASVNRLRWTEQLLHGNLQNSMLQLFTQSQTRRQRCKTYHIVLKIRVCIWNQRELVSGLQSTINRMMSCTESDTTLFKPMLSASDACIRKTAVALAGRTLDAKFMFLLSSMSLFSAIQCETNLLGSTPPTQAGQLTMLQYLSCPQFLVSHASTPPPDITATKTHAGHSHSKPPTTGNFV